MTRLFANIPGILLIGVEYTWLTTMLVGGGGLFLLAFFAVACLNRRG